MTPKITLRRDRPKRPLTEAEIVKAIQEFADKLQINAAATERAVDKLRTELTGGEVHDNRR